jgi:PhnB protein
LPPDWCGKIVHTTLTKPQGFYVMLSIEEIADAEGIYHALAENGTVRMPMQKTFWSPGFAALIDQFGTPWEISTRL